MSILRNEELTAENDTLGRNLEEIKNKFQETENYQ